MKAADARGVPRISVRGGGGAAVAEGHIRARRASSLGGGVRGHGPPENSELFNA